MRRLASQISHKASTIDLQVSAGVLPMQALSTPLSTDSLLLAVSNTMNELE